DKAGRSGLDPAELGACLGSIRPAPDSELALVPVGAYRGSYGNEEAWFLVCKWEYPRAEATLGHVRIWAIAPKTQKVLGFVTCR
ncbi:MAG TPA: hypothetical protein VEN81_16210, partial [Planctomycetota bacterium]|nr:hypothetical protein [Planctomycetota bacterium]